MRRTSRWIALIATGALWAAAVAAGLKIMANYEIAPGPEVSAPQMWPAASRIERDPSRPTLVMLAHPRCPCTRASLGELAILMARCRDRLAARVVFARPAGTPVGWERTDLWESAAGIPGVMVIADEGEAEARRFAAKTSGETLLYGADGRLLFDGGITISRGHAGDNFGRSAIQSLVLSGKPAMARTRVFGCSLESPVQPTDWKRNE